MIWYHYESASETEDQAILQHILHFHFLGQNLIDDLQKNLSDTSIFIKSTDDEIWNLILNDITQLFLLASYQNIEGKIVILMIFIHIVITIMQIPLKPTIL